VLEPGGTSWTLEHRENVVMGRRQDRTHRGICARARTLLCGHRCAHVRRT
jgi:hypothetical protein